jgi:hypothetical protein
LVEDFLIGGHCDDQDFDEKIKKNSDKNLNFGCQPIKNFSDQSKVYMMINDRKEII